MQKGFTKGEQNIAGGHHCVKNDSGYFFIFLFFILG
jgi:hypothetical protein